MSTTLDARLEALRQKYGKMLKPELAEKMERHIAQLRADGSLDRVLKAGAKAPAFSLRDQDGNLVSSADLLAQGPLVVSFYRGTWCPYCNEEIAALAAENAALKDAGASLVAITPQSRENASGYRGEHPVPFPILVDPDAKTAEAFGLAYTMPNYLSELYKNVFSNDLAVVNEAGTWRLPIPARFVIAQDSTIVDVQADADYRYRPEPSATVATVRGLTAAAR